MFSSVLWIIWHFLDTHVLFIAGEGGLFYLPHAARVLCIVYFGYKAIIDLRIHQNYIPKHNHMKQSNEKQIDKDDIEFVKQNVKEFQNSDLKKSLLNLGNKITTEDK